MVTPDHLEPPDYETPLARAKLICKIQMWYEKKFKHTKQEYETVSVFDLIADFIIETKYSHTASNGPGLVPLDRELLLETFNYKLVRRIEECCKSDENPCENSLVRYVYSLSPESFSNLMLRKFGQKMMPTVEEIEMTIKNINMDLIATVARCATHKEEAKAILNLFEEKI